jgi:hypothetical protein
MAARWFGQEQGACRCIMRRRCGGRELDDHAEAGDLAVALEARPNDRAVEKGSPDAWATDGPRRDPLLAPRRDGVEFVGSSEKNQRLGCVDVGQVGEGWRWRLDDEGARDPAGGQTRGDVGLGGCAGNIAGEGLVVPPKPPPNSVSAVFPKLPP